MQDLHSLLVEHCSKIIPSKKELEGAKDDRLSNIRDLCVSVLNSFGYCVESVDVSLIRFQPSENVRYQLAIERFHDMNYRKKQMDKVLKSQTKYQFPNLFGENNWRLTDISK